MHCMLFNGEVGNFLPELKKKKRFCILKRKRLNTEKYVQQFPIRTKIFHCRKRFHTEHVESRYQHLVKNASLV